jgi:hypothetical protein
MGAGTTAALVRPGRMRPRAEIKRTRRNEAEVMELVIVVCGRCG